MSPRWRYFLIGYLWSLPHALFGLFWFLLNYRAAGWRWSDGCIECIAAPDQMGPNTSAQTHGWLICYASEEDRNNTLERVHERVHVVQGFVGGIFYVLAYVALYFYGRWRYRNETYPAWRAYRYNPLEVMAYNRQAHADSWGS